MKKILILFLFLLTIIVLNAQSEYYWYKGKKITLEKISMMKYILFEGIEDTTSLKKLLKLPNAIVLNNDKIDLSENLHAFNQINIKEKKWVIIKDRNIAEMSFTIHEQILYESNFYLTTNNIEAGLSHLFYVKLKNTGDLKELEKLANNNNVEILGNNKFMPLWYTLSCSKESNGDALDMANLFYETGIFAVSEPDLMTDDLPLCTNDTHFNNQWGLNNTGQNGGTAGIDINFCQSRQITTGDQDIIIAVLDQGIEDHPDLLNIHALSFDTESGTSPSLVLGSHGTACAGIIGAGSNNSIGVSGIAPICPLMSISNSLGSNPNSRQRRADGLNFAWQNGASVISNSWGSGVQYQIIDDAIDNVLTQGRNGLGCIIVFAAGNNNGAVSYPANSNDDIIVVGALSPCGERKNPSSCDGENWWGSNYGTELDIMAPGVLVPTTDRQGTNGYNTSPGTAGDYIQNFNGTSSACPHVAVVAGLILSQNPNLTQNEVSDIIESTAQKLGGYNYQTTSGRPNGTWHEDMGYGVLDAFEAVQLACPTTDFVNQTVTSTTNVSGCNVNLQNVYVQNNSKLTIEAINEVIINGEFEVDLGSELEIE